MRGGVLPLWNPFVFGGVPFQAGAHGYLYPGWWTGIALPAALDIKVGILLHLSLAAMGGAWFARGRVESRLAAYLAGTTYALSAVLVIHLFAGHRVLVASAAWLPWVAGSLDRWLRGRGGIVTGVAATALLWLSAHYQVAFIGLGGLLLFCLLDALLGEPRQTGRSTRLRHAGRAGLAWGGLGLAGAAVAAVQILPALRAAALSQRAAGGAGFAASYASAPANLLTYLLPHLFGNRVDAPFVGDWSYWESLGYLGLVPLALLVFGAVALPWRRWLPAALVMALALGLTLGDHTPLFGLYRALVPGAELFRAPGRFGLLVTLLASLLAAQAFDAWLAGRVCGRRLAAALAPVALLAATPLALLPWLDPADPAGLLAAHADPNLLEELSAEARALLDSRGDALVAAVCLAATAALLLVGARDPTRLRTAALLLLAIHANDLYRFGHRFLGTAAAEVFQLPAGLAEHVRQRGGLGARMVPPPERRWNDLGSVSGIGNPGGFDILVDRRYARYLNRAQGEELERFFSMEMTLLGSPLIRHLGVGFLAASLPLEGGEGGGFEGWPWLEPATQVGGIHLHRDPGAAPRAALVHRFEVVADELEAYRRMEAPGFDVRDVALLEAPPALGAARPEPPAAGAVERAELVVYEPNRVEIAVEASAPALLVLSDTLQPGWSARVDGAEASLLHANRVMRAVPIPAGRHHVVMTYLPREFVAGAVVSALAVAALGASALRARRPGLAGPRAR
jgi:hypothetical protein